MVARTRIRLVLLVMLISLTASASTTTTASNGQTESDNADKDTKKDVAEHCRRTTLLLSVLLTISISAVGRTVVRHVVFACADGIRQASQGLSIRSLLKLVWLSIL